MRLKATYGSREVAALTGLTARQLQSWDAGGLLHAAIPTRRTSAGGHTERRYTPIELIELLTLSELRGLGFSVHQLHTIVQVLRDEFGVRLYEATGGGRLVELLTDGREIYVRTAAGKFFNVLEAPTQPLLVVGDESLLKTLEGKTGGRRRKRAKVSGSGISSRGRRPGAE